MTIRVAHKIPILIFFPGQNYPFCLHVEFAIVSGHYIGNLPCESYFGLDMNRGKVSPFYSRCSAIYLLLQIDFHH